MAPLITPLLKCISCLPPILCDPLPPDAILRICPPVALSASLKILGGRSPRTVPTSKCISPGLCATSSPLPDAFVLLSP